MSDQKKQGFMKGFGSGAIIIAIVMAGYVFGLKEDPKQALTDSVVDTYTVAAVGKNSVEDLKKNLPDLDQKQIEKLDQTIEALGNVENEAVKIATLLNIKLPDIDKIEPSEIKTDVSETLEAEEVKTSDSEVSE